MRKARETASLLLLPLLGVVLRLSFVAGFPTIPFSDFKRLVAFGQYLHEHGFFSNPPYWEDFNAGMPFFLAWVFNLYPCVEPESAARLATAVACGLLAIVPFLIWRGVLPFGMRLAAGAFLALWPGQILFTGVVAQDNWVLLPAVPLATLAVRVLVKRGEAWPVAAGILYTVGVFIRQEMLIVLLPFFLAAAGLTWPLVRRRAVIAVFAAGVPLLLLAAYRNAATGRFSLSTEHPGMAALGAYVPGAAINGWADPLPYVAAVRPDLLFGDHNLLLSQASSLAFHEAFRRPFFHAARIVSATALLTIMAEGRSLYWSLQAPEVLPPAVHDRGFALVERSLRPLRWEMEAIQGLFLAAVIIGIRRRNRAILVLLAAVLLKYGIHALSVTQGRYFYAATAWEVMAILLAADEVRTAALPFKGLPLRALAAGAAFSCLLTVFAPLASGIVIGCDVDQQRTYRFPIESPDRTAALACVVDRGVLVSLGMRPARRSSATVRTFHSDPAPGEAAVARCELTGSGEPRPLVLQVLDPYAPGGLAGRMLQRVELDGAEVFSHDVAEQPGTGWANIPLGPVGAGTHRTVVIEIKALHPDPGAKWGDAVQTQFQLSPPDTPGM